MLESAVLLANGKGGVGKTSLTANIAGLAAEAGYRTLAVDLDPQGNLGRDLGYFRSEGDDRGQALLEALQFGRPIEPLKDVRPGLDVVVGGSYVDDVVKIAGNLADRGRNPRTVLEEALRPIASRYHLILVDTPPGDRYLQDIALCAGHYVVIPTRSDEASLDGLSRAGEAFLNARQVNPQLELLGVVLFGIGASATRIQKTVRDQVQAGLGDVAPVFNTQIRYLEAPAVQARALGKLVHEYERDLVSKAPKWYERRKSGKATQQEYWAQSAHKLAGDYALLTTEILNAVVGRKSTQAVGS